VTSGIESTMAPDSQHGRDRLPGADRQERHAKKDEIGFELPRPASVSKGRLVIVGVVAAAVLGGVFLVGFLPNRRARTELAQSTEAAHAALPKVDFVMPRESTSMHSLNLPAAVRPLEETTLYSRADGFVKNWKADIGDKVKEGEVLAELETPELDQELAQARAQLAQAEAATKQAAANSDFARSTFDRYTKLNAEGLATSQDLDEKKSQVQVNLANVDVANATVGTQKANLARLYRLKSFASVTAPFAGIVTARLIDRGALVVAGNSAPLFKVAATDPVRVFVDVPQDLAPSVKVDQPASIAVREFPGKPFAGKVSRTSGALDPASRTLTTEIRVPNPDNVLLTGMYVEASLSLPIPHRTFEIPATAVSTGAKGVRVQVVDDSGAVHFVPVVIERDLGSTVFVSSGLNGGERVLKLASAELADGAHVEATQKDTTPAGAPPK
jgi:membrane fusion protein (multidrug efflux system)